MTRFSYTHIYTHNALFPSLSHTCIDISFHSLLASWEILSKFGRLLMTISFVTLIVSKWVKFSAFLGKIFASDFVIYSVIHETRGFFLTSHLSLQPCYVLLQQVGSFKVSSFCPLSKYKSISRLGTFCSPFWQFSSLDC